MSSFIQRRTLAEHLLFTRQVSDLCAHLGGDHSKRVNSLVQAGRLREVVDYDINYADCSLTYSDLKYLRQILALFQKQDFIDVGYDTEAEAKKTFNGAEERCLKTNKLFDESVPVGTVASVLFLASRKITSILGEVPSLSALDLSFGSGANTNVKSAEASFRRKLSASLACSEETVPVLKELLAELPMLSLHHAAWTVNDRTCCYVEVHPGRLSFVPKTCKTKRSVIVEPILNSMVQRGIGSYLKTRLLHAGINLRDQKRNQYLAWRGSLDSSLATVDLSSASDCISIAVVYSLLPPAWANFLAQFRTGKVMVGPSIVELEKFSSMGNGFTFELESIIFYSLAYAVVDFIGGSQQNVSVFGDDIIVPAEAYALLEIVLMYCGFSVNTKKSFSSGFFRESCGADWYHGLDIRPFYLKDQISDETLYVFHNWAMRNCERELASLVHSWTYAHNRIYGPDGYGDGHLIGDYSLRLNRKLRRSGWCGGFFDTYTRKEQHFRRLLPGDWLVPSYSVYTRAGRDSPTDPDIVRGSRGYAKISIYTLATSIFRRL